MTLRTFGALLLFSGLSFSLVAAFSAVDALLSTGLRHERVVTGLIGGGLWVAIVGVTLVILDGNR